MSRRLTREDRELWERLKTSVKPLRPAAAAPAIVAADAARAAAERAAASAPSPGGVAQPGSPPPRASPTLSALEQRKLKRLARGLTEVDARIDLHGMRQERAFARLIGFLREHQARDARLVLVITGKGLDGGEGRGVLKQAVPMWLARPEFRDLVVGFGEAGRRHGGSGALYVQIRRRSRIRATAS